MKETHIAKKDIQEARIDKDHKRMFDLISLSGRPENRDLDPDQIIEKIVAPELEKWEAEGADFSLQVFKTVFKAVKSAHTHLIPTYTEDTMKQPYTTPPAERVKNAADKFAIFETMFENWFKQKYPDRS